VRRNSTLNIWRTRDARRGGLRCSVVLGEQKNCRKNSLVALACSKPFSLIESPAPLTSSSTISWAAAKSSQPQRMCGSPSHKEERPNLSAERSTLHRDCERPTTPRPDAGQNRFSVLLPRRDNPDATATLRTHDASKIRGVFYLLSPFTDWPPHQPQVTQYQGVMRNYPTTY
jgi:hypothetical protein